MKKRVFLFGALMALIINVFGQRQEDFRRFEIKSGIGLFVEIYKLNILSPDADPLIDIYKNIRSGDPRAGRKIWYGRSTWFQLGYRWNKKYQLYANYYVNPYKIPYNDPLGLWWEVDEKQVYHSVRAGVNRIFNADGKFNYKVGIGLVYQREIVERAVYQPWVSGTSTVIIPVANYAEKFNSEEGGFDLNFDAEYNISKTATFGMRFNTYYLYQLGLEGITISPFIGVRF